MIWGKLSLPAVARVAIVFLALLSAAASATVSGPSNSATAQFTVSYSCGSPCYKFLWGILEVIHNGTIIAKYNGAGQSGTKQITVGESGSYIIQYRWHQDCLQWGPPTDMGCKVIGGHFISSHTTHVTFQPGVPTSISIPASDNNGAFTVSWGASSGDVSKYELYQQKDGGGWSLVYSGTGTSKAISGLGDGAYAYRVRACNTVSTFTSCGDYRTSGSAIVANAPGVPPSISGIPSTSNSGSFTASWGTSTGSVDKYELYQQKDGGGWSLVYSGTGSSKAISGLGDGTYAYRVRACNTVSIFTSCSGYRTSGSAIVANAPGVPPSISGIPPTGSSGNLTVSWGASTGSVDKYELYQQKNGGSWTLIYSGTGLSKSITGLGDGAYAYQVRACNTFSTYTACSGYRTSGNIIVAIPPGAPPSISGITATNNTGSFSISWGASAGTVDGYKLEQQKDGGSWSNIYTGTGTSSSVLGLTYGVYVFRVRAYNSESTYTAYSGYRTSGSAIVAIAPGTPGTISGVPGTDTDGAFTISWAVPTGTIDKYELEQQKDGGSWGKIFDGTDTSMPVAGLVDGTYKFRVRACNVVLTYASCGDYKTSGTSIVADTPAIPGSFTGLPVSDSDGSFTITWGSATGADTYELEQKKDSGSWANIYTDTNVTASVSSLSEGTYSFRVRACNTVSTFKNCSSYKTSSSVIVIYPPSVPASISAPVEAGSFTVSWPASTGTVTKYTLQQKVDAGAWVTKQDTNTLSYAASGIAGGKNYTYQVRACNDYYCSAYKTGSQTYAPYPAPVINLYVSGVNLGADGKYPIGWDGIYTAAWTISGQLSSFTLQESSDGTNWQVIATSGSEISFSKPANYGPGNNDYLYRMQACNVDGCSAWKTMTAAVAPYPIPNGPGNITTSSGPTTGGSYTLAWGASNGPVVTHYTLQERPLNGSWGTEINVGNNLQYPVSGKASGDTYQYRVKACNTDQACSNYSDIFNVYIPYAAPSVPTDLQVDVQPTSDGNFIVSWSASTGHVETYQLEQRYEGGSWIQVQNNSTLSYTASGSASGDYEYRVRACNTDACSAYVDILGIYVPYSAPSVPESLELTVAPTAQGVLSLAWQASTGRVDNYILEQRYNGTGSWAQIQNGADTMAAITGAQSGNNDYRVKACNIDACGAYTAVLTIYVPYPAPGVPTGLQTVGTVTSAGNFTLDWADSTGVVGYYIIEHRTSGGGWLQIASPVSSEASITSAPSDNNDYRVKACNSDNCSSNSAVFTVYVPYPPPSTPVGLDITTAPTSAGNFAFAWNVSGGKVDYYLVEHRYGSSGTWGEVQNGPATSLTASGIDSGDSQYRVKACNSDACSGYSSALDVYVPFPAPSIPASFRIENGPNAIGLLSLAWEPSSGRVDSYVLQMRKDDGIWSNVYTGTDTQKTQELFAGGNYEFRVQACNVDNCSEFSSIIELIRPDLEGTVDVAVPPHQEAAPINTSAEVLASDRVGVVGGEFRVSESGSAGYSIPIVTGPASGGAVPSISLSYSSESGNGPLGMGWNIGGLSAISACRRTMEEDGVNGSAFDRYCLDGQRLVLVTGSQGAVGSMYRTSMDSFVRAKLVSTSVGSNKGFEVYRKDGSISYYGLNEDSFETNVWYLDKQVDSVGNYIEYQYLKDTVIGEHLIQKVHYSGNGYDSTANVIEFNYDTGRTDKIFGYAFGAKKSMTRSLTSVISKADGVELRRYVPEYETSGTGRLRLASIKECVSGNCRPATGFDYAEFQSQGFAQSFHSTSGLSANLSDVKVGDVNGDGRQDLVYVRRDTSSGHYHFKVAFGTATGGFTLPSTYIRARTNARKDWHLVDYNDDGKDDLLHAPSADIIFYYTWRVNLFESSFFAQHGTAGDVNTGIPYTSDQRGSMYDFNSDGLPDHIKQTSGDVIASGSSAPKAVVRLLKRKADGGLAFEPNDTEVSFNLPSTPDHGWLYNKTASIKLRDTDLVADLNGDGIADMTAIVNITFTCTEPEYDCPNQQKTISYSYFVLYQSASEASYQVAFQTTASSEFQQFLPDLNGDGLPDLLYRTSDSGAWNIRHNTGTGFVSAGSITLPSNADSSKLQFVDYNGDGLTDLLYSNYDKLWVLPNSPTGFGTAFNTNLDWDTNSSHTQLVADVDGDGNPDLVHTYHSSSSANKYVRIYRPNHYNKPVDVLTTVTNGFGVKTEIQYARLNDAGAKVYTRKTGSSALSYGKGSPVFDLYSPMYVVKKAISDAPAANDDGNTVEAQYHYTGARMQSGGRGFLGFEQITTYDPQNQVKTTTKYRQDYPYIGMPVETSKVIEPNAANIATAAACTGTGLTLISCSTNTVAFVEPLAGKTKLPYISKAIDKSYDIDGTYLGRVETQIIYDSAYPDDIKYGNVSKLILENFDAAGAKVQNKITTNTYSNEVNNSRWHLARLTESTVATQRYGSLASAAIPRVANFAYDSATGLLTDEWVEKDTTLELHTHYEHDRFGNRTETTVTDADGNSRTNKTTYDSFGRYPRTEVNALNQTTAQVIGVDVYGQPLVSLDIDGVRTIRATSQFGEAYFEHHETGSHSTSLKAMCDGCVTVAGIDSHFKVTTKGIDQTETIVYHDRLGREIRKQTQDFHGDPVYVDTQYDEQSRAKAVSEPYGASESPRWISYTYDKLGRTKLVDAPIGQCDVSSVYSGLTETATACGQSKTTKKNPLGEVAEITDNIGGKLQYSYYADGQLKNVKVLDITGVQTALTSIEYDQVGRKTRLIDPDKGSWSYGYTGFGELKWQKDAKGQGTAMSYDKLGRMVTRADYVGFDTQTQSGALKNFSRWYFDQDLTCNTQNRFDGKLLAVAQASVEIQAGCSFNVEDIHYLKLFRHDRYGRLGETVTTTGALTESEGDFYEKVAYDKYSRAHQAYDAANQQVAQGGNYLYGAETAYNPYGYKLALKNLETGSAYYTVQNTNIRGQVTEIQLGNGLTTSYVYDGQSHRLTDILTSVMPGIGQVQNLHYDWDAIGNLMSKTDLSGDGSYSKDLQEGYEYDGLNRLRYARLYLAGSLTSTHEVSYYDNGNIKTKTGVGTYTYGSARPHAVTNTSTGNISYVYDLNGNLTSDGNGRGLTYAVFDKPTLVSKGSHSTNFWYDPDRNRYKRVDDNGSGTVTTLQIGSVEKVTERGSSGAFVKAYYRRSIGGVVVEKMDLDQSDSVTGRNLQYLLKDLQGSLDVITTATGQVAQENGVKQVFSFDAWGKRRSPFTWAQLTTPENIVSTLKVGTFNHLRTNRGYTGHEMLDETGLIHMNGRVYDPTLARFVSADPTIDGVTSVQGFNRYAYVHNNPLAYSDPSGYSRWMKYRDRVVKPIVAIIVAVVSYGWASEWAASWGYAAFAEGAVGNAMVAGAVSGAASGFVSGGMASGNLRGAFRGAFTGAVTGAAMGGVGAWAQGTHIVIRMAAMGITNGILTDLQGGKFAHGFATAGIPGAVSGNAVVRIIVAGLISDATGGKFASGALTAAFMWALSSANSQTGGEISGDNAADINRLDQIPENPQAVYDEAVSKSSGNPYVTEGATTQFVDKIKVRQCLDSGCNKNRFGPAFDSVGEAKKFLAANPSYTTVDGLTVDNTRVVIYRTATSPLKYPITDSLGLSKAAAGRIPSVLNLSGTENVIRVLAHEGVHVANPGTQHGDIFTSTERKALEYHRK